MKTLEQKVGNETVTVEVQRCAKAASAPHAVKLIARYGTEMRLHVHTFNPKLDRTPEDFDASIQRAAQRLAEETVAHAQASAHIDKVLSG